MAVKRKYYTVHVLSSTYEHEHDDRNMIYPWGAHDDIYSYDVCLVRCRVTETTGCGREQPRGNASARDRASELATDRGKEVALRGKERVRPLVRFVCVPSEASRGSSNASRREAASVASDASIHASRALSHDQPGRSGWARSVQSCTVRSDRRSAVLRRGHPSRSPRSRADPRYHVVPVWSAVDPPALGLALSPRNHLPSLTCRQELRAMNEVYVGRRGLGGVDGAHASST